LTDNSKHNKPPINQYASIHCKYAASTL